MGRPLNEQFEPDKAAALQSFAGRLRLLRYPPGASRYYGLELATCIESGAIAAALIVASALLELHVRALVVNFATRARRPRSRTEESLERQLENRRDMGFAKLLDHLVEVDLFRADDAARAKVLYSKIRIPLLHGLPSRFVEDHQFPIFPELNRLLGREMITLRDFEDTIESHGLKYLEDIIGTIERNGF